MTEPDRSRLRLLLSPATPWRIYAGLIGLGSAALATLGFAAWMFLDRPQAEPVVAAVASVIFARHGPYEPGDYGFYFGLLIAMGLVFLGVGFWSVPTNRVSEQRLDRRLMEDLEAVQQRNTRTLD